jgi:outer membrane protein OmpA-like peptidoglycan-associated protein
MRNQKCALHPGAGIIFTACFCILVAGIGAARAAEPVTKDLIGRDHPLLKRYEGSFIVRYSQNAFDEYKLVLGKSLNPSSEGNKSKRVEKQQAIQGKITRITYFAPKGRSTLEVFKNYENELTAKQAETLFTGSGSEELGHMFGLLPQYEGLDGQLFDYSNDDARYGAYKLGGNYFVIYAAAYDYGATHHPIEKGQIAVQVDIIESKPMQEKMVAVDASEMDKQIETNGKVALYGIYFDFNKTDLKPESEAALVEIGKLLQTKPALNVLVVGHTDAVGSFESNRTLSQHRADAIVAALVTKQRIDSKRLFPVGVSFASPVATNATEEGRAKNRRVELVAIPEAK